MFLGRVEQARALYLRYCGYKNVQGEKSWGQLIDLGILTY